MTARPPQRPDVGLTHVALAVRDARASIDFYADFARMEVVHDRRDHDRRVVWLSDRTRPFVIVLIEMEPVDATLGGIAHLGVGLESREAVDRLCERAREQGCLRLGPTDSGPPVGYWAILSDPDGHNLELSFGQEVGLTVSAPQARGPRGEAD